MNIPIIVRLPQAGPGDQLTTQEGEMTIPAIFRENALSQPYVQWHFGNCPQCHRCSGCRNVGPVGPCMPGNYFTCDTHKVRWYASGGYFQGTPSLTADEEEYFFRAYRELHPDEVWTAESHLDELPPEEAEAVAEYRRSMALVAEYDPMTEKA